MDEMRQLCLEIFHTHNPKDLQEIAEKAKKYDRLFEQEYPVSLRNAGRKARFTQRDREAMIDMYREGTPIQEVAHH